MSKHIGRKQRWVQESARRHVSDLGAVVHERGAWYALLEYKIRAAPTEAHGLPLWDAQSMRLGPFKRPRNAMVALEREVTLLRNRHGDDVHIGEQPGTAS